MSKHKKSQKRQSVDENASVNQASEEVGNTGGSNKEAKIEVEGVIVKALPNLVFEVQLPDDFGGQIIQGYLGGKMRVHYIKIIPGDRVLVELSPYDLTKGRIVFRKK